MQIFLFKLKRFILFKLSRWYLISTIIFIFLLNEEEAYKRVILINNRRLKKFLIGYLIKKFPNYPYTYFERYKLSLWFGDMKHYYYLEQYSKLIKNYLKKNFSEFQNREYLDAKIFFGAFGNQIWFYSLLLANKMKLRKNKKIYLLKQMELTNKALFKYFEKYIEVVSDKDMIEKQKILDQKLSLYLGFMLEIEGKFLKLTNAHNLLMEKNKHEKIKIFNVSKSDKSKGFEYLKSLGFNPSKDWFVTLHIREGNYRKNEKNENYRNCKPEDYIPAIKSIIDNGGLVFRMGHKGSKEFLKHDRFIDYANSEKKFEELEIFLGAESKFSICTSSGYSTIPSIFNVPMLLTNCPNHNGFFELSHEDLYLPKLFKSLETNEIIKIKNLFCPPYGNLYTDELYKKFKLKVIDNNPDEIKESAHEMIKKYVHNQSISSPLQEIINKKILEEQKKINSSLVPVANLSSSFLEKNRQLI